ncbi:hypothetical protein L218DRAFT_871377 [Marasmius fiardii PR-910]|nr:hypothetical protein L218DRAFT_871377 [Marasmius fiardii PR-910]
MLGKNIWRATLKCRDRDSSTISIPILVKFSRHYSAPSHRLLESAGLAPKLYFCDLEQDPEQNDIAPGSFYWRMIVMEFISNAVTLYDFTGTPGDARQIMAQLYHAVELLHAEGCVFGDLRPTNIMVEILEDRGDGEERKIRVALVDFDWAGKDGKARYPPGISVGGGIAWPEGVKPRGLITKAHDLYWLRTWADILS